MFKKIIRHHSIFEYFLILFQKKQKNNISSRIKNKMANIYNNIKILELIQKFNINQFDFIIFSDQFWYWFCDIIAPIYIERKNINNLVTNLSDYRDDNVNDTFDVAAVKLIVYFHNVINKDHIKLLNKKCKYEFNESDIEKMNSFSKNIQKEFKKYIFQNFDLTLFI